MGGHPGVQLLSRQPDHLPYSHILLSWCRIHDLADRSRKPGGATITRMLRRTRRGIASSRREHQMSRGRHRSLRPLTAGRIPALPAEAPTDQGAFRLALRRGLGSACGGSGTPAMAAIHSAAELEALKALLAAGLSRSEIGARLGLRRSVLCWLVHRLKRKGVVLPRSRPGPKPKTITPPKPLPTIAFEPLTATAAPLLELDDNACRWPVCSAAPVAAAAGTRRIVGIMRRAALRSRRRECSSGRGRWCGQPSVRAIHNCSGCGLDLHRVSQGIEEAGLRSRVYPRVAPRARGASRHRGGPARLVRAGGARLG